VFIEAKDDGGGSDTQVTTGAISRAKRIITTNKPKSAVKEAKCN